MRRTSAQRRPVSAKIANTEYSLPAQADHLPGLEIAKMLYVVHDGIDGSSRQWLIEGGGLDVFKGISDDAGAQGKGWMENPCCCRGSTKASGCARRPSRGQLYCSVGGPEVRCELRQKI